MSPFEAKDFGALAFIVTDNEEHIRLMRYDLERRNGSGVNNE